MTTDLSSDAHRHSNTTSRFSKECLAKDKTQDMVWLFTGSSGSQSQKPDKDLAPLILRFAPWQILGKHCGIFQVTN